MAEPQSKPPPIERIEARDAGEDRYAALNDAVACSRAERVEVAGLSVERRAFESLGGFHEGVLAGAEYDLALRLRAHGADVELPARPGGAAARWLGRRHKEIRARPSLRDLAGFLAAENRVASRRAAPRPVPDPARGVVVVTDAYPARSETFVFNEVAALREAGWSVRVESSARPARYERAAARAARIDYLEDDPPLRGLLDLVPIAVRHPLRVLGDLRSRRRWRREEPVWPLRALAPAIRRLEAGGERHLHVHFAAGAALNAMRIARLAGVSYSVVGHGYDVFAEPRNLPEKLASARFVVAPCEYTAAHLRRLLPFTRSADVHVVVMGVDAERFRRRAAHPAGRHVVAIGRLVEKKGFIHLIEAAGRLAAGPAALKRLTIAGDGPLRAGLENAIAAAGLGGVAEIADVWGAEGVRELLEGADLLAMPAVIASDGDRDAMPVVVKEALAAEVPVVASDAVGLPELIEPAWGRLVGPGDALALAAAIEELLALPAERRAEMGAAGRARVIARCDQRAEAARLGALLESATLSRRR